MTIWYVGENCCAIAYFQLRYAEAFCLYVYAVCMIFAHALQNRIFKVIMERKLDKKKYGKARPNNEAK